MMSGSIRTYLEEHEFFRGLAPEYLDAIDTHVTEEEYAAQQCVFAQDTEANHFYIVTAGQVDVEVPSLVGAPLVLQSLTEGSVLGWSWLIHPYKWHFEARAIKPSTLLVFDGRQLRARCESDPAFGYELLKRFAALMMHRLEAARIQAIEAFEGP
ncbi:MAG: cyclic nucleotide-binding domain-containing protein [Gammaproteobacteria bacterium]|nr:cyclic nucleotide-binding domain-containing protein [Gammaproteobacteria bacterium]